MESLTVVLARHKYPPWINPFSPYIFRITENINFLDLRKRVAVGKLPIKVYCAKPIYNCGMPLMCCTDSNKTFCIL
jgi:hypothetical protein